MDEKKEDTLISRKGTQTKDNLLARIGQCLGKYRYPIILSLFTIASAILAAIRISDTLTVIFVFAGFVLAATAGCSGIFCVPPDKCYGHKGVDSDDSKSVNFQTVTQGRHSFWSARTSPTASRIVVTADKDSALSNGR